MSLVMSQMDNQATTIASQVNQLTEAMKETNKLQSTVVKLMKTGYIIIAIMLLLLMLF